MAIATATSIDVYAGGELLFAEVSFKLEARERMTLSGRNGAGKSTLLRVLAGERPPDSGTVSRGKGARVALHDQRPPRDSEATLGDYVLTGRAEMLEAEAELTRLEAAMAAGEPDAETLREYAATQQRHEAGGGYRWRDEVLAVLGGLGFGDADAGRRLSTFSGGELTRASLARVLAARPDLLLLDEPTNHLDIPSLEWLERYLVGLEAAVVLVAHDRWFLEAVGTSVLEIEARRGRFFAGPWHAWRKEQAAREIARGKAIVRQEAEIARMERFVERFRYKATKARQAQSRLKTIEKIKRDGARAEERDRRHLRFSFAAPERPGRVVVKLVNGEDRGSGPRPVRRREPRSRARRARRPRRAQRRRQDDADRDPGREARSGGRLGSHRPQRQGRLPIPARGHGGGGGDRARGSPARHPPRRTEGARPARRLPLLRRRRGEIARRHLRRRAAPPLAGDPGRLGGQRSDPRRAHQPPRRREPRGARGRPARLRGSGDPRLARPGAAGGRRLPHDRLRGRQPESYPYGWADYQRRRDEAAEAASAEEAAAKREARAGGKRRRPGAEAKSAERKAARLAEQIEQAEAELRAIEDELADPDAWSSPQRAERANERHEDAKRKLAELYEQWEEAEAAVSAAADPA